MRYYEVIIEKPLNNKRVAFGVFTDLSILQKLIFDMFPSNPYEIKIDTIVNYDCDKTDIFVYFGYSEELAQEVEYNQLIDDSSGHIISL